MKFKANQEVRVISVKYTKSSYGTNSEMLDEVHTTQKISAMDGSNCAKINGCYWDVRDLQPINFKEKEPQVFHFDEGLLERT